MDKKTILSILKSEPYINIPKIVRPDSIIREVEKHSGIKDPDELSAITGRIHQAIAMASAAHSGIVRKSGEPYIFHPYTVAYLLAVSGMDDDCVIAGLLHDTVEDTSMTVEEIGDAFGKNVANLVDGVTKLTEIREKTENEEICRKLSREEKQATAIKKLLTFAQNDSRIIIIKLFDRLHNMMTLDAMIPEKQKRIALETLNLYVPLAHRLGIYWLKEALEALSFYFGFPEEWAEIDRGVNTTYPNLAALTASIDEKTKNVFQKFAPLMWNKISKVYCKTKSYYYIYTKTLKKNLEVGDLKNILSVRIVLKTDDVFDCYKVLGMLHLFPEMSLVQRYLKDYIATPKVNGYQSLHTLLRFKEYFVEFQICTEQMERIAQEGQLAKWKAKNDPAYKDTLAEWLKTIFSELIDSSSKPETFVSDIENLLPLDKMIVFTPDGEEISLPEGATLLDFAYAIHSDLGEKCIGGTVNGKRVTISQVLQNKDEVKVETAENQNPREDWLDFVKTQRAKQFIKKYIQKQQEKILENKGREILKPLFVSQEKGEFFDTLGKQRAFINFAKKYSLPKQNTLSAFFIKTASGELKLESVIEAFFSHDEISRLINAFPRRVAPLFVLQDERAADISPIFIKGTGMISDYKIARCCQPVEGDCVVASVSSDEGYILHKQKCPKIARIDAEHLEENVYWFEYPRYEISFIISLQNRKGALMELANELNDKNFNISSLHLNADDADEYSGKVYVTVQGSDIQAVENLRESLKDKEVIIDFNINNIHYRG
ncbi:bifunctional (p)ppGpp synthetase/guanosine-3',5'-bis(diphosphate) 3'-pyrophosphohydrolase [bacterium]|nr:bifunctional (p)ppGpp synthetase/guanosine-3',5'-bis(diphosphate) 3'-pyrophosphohydrolase [bacterium]MBP5592343.1 bifunctional (p)ppGpp synthetase/guanosine-3',5'-bis(diphosphate) 3'-pyrophosphohydrolase [bacterium]